MSTDKIRILILGDHANMRLELSELIASDNSYNVVSVISHNQSVIRAVANLSPDVVVIDSTMRRGTLTETIGQLKTLRPDVKIVVLSFDKSYLYDRASLDAGAAAYVLLDDSRQELCSALERVVQGEHYRSPNLSADRGRFRDITKPNC